MATGELGQRLQAWRQRHVLPVVRVLHAGWRWWITELQSLLPESLRAMLATARQQTFLQLSGDELIVFHGNIDRMQEIGRCPLDATAACVEPPAGTRGIVLLLPPQLVLQRTIRLPEATEQNLCDVLGFEMDRQTPFRRDQVYFNYVIANRSAEDRTIDVDLVVAPRKQLDTLLATLAALNLSPDIVSTRREAGGMYAFSLLPSPARHGLMKGIGWLDAGLAGACALLLMAVITVPLLQKRQVIAELEPRAEAAENAAREGLRVRDTIENTVSVTRMLVEKKETTPMIVRLLDDMTRIVPDGTWISQIDIDGGEIQIQGQSPAAASLIGLIEQSGSFVNPQFRSPVTQVPRTDLERFHLSAEWAGVGSR